jgi:hypothetical protein
VSNSEKGYYIKGKPVKSGIFFEWTNKMERAERLVISKQIHHEAAVLYPSDISEYGFPGERRYVSAEIVLNGNPKKEDLCYFHRTGGTFELIRDEEVFWDLSRNASCPEVIAFVDSNWLIRKQVLSAMELC